MNVNSFDEIRTETKEDTKKGQFLCSVCGFLTNISMLAVFTVYAFFNPDIGKSQTEHCFVEEGVPYCKEYLAKGD